VRIQHVFDLDRRDVFAAGDDDVAGPVAKLDVAVRMHDREIAAVVPAPNSARSGRNTCASRRVGIWRRRSYRLPACADRHGCRQQRLRPTRSTSHCSGTSGGSTNKRVGYRCRTSAVDTGAFLPFGVDFAFDFASDFANEIIRCIHSSGFAMAQADDGLAFLLILLPTGAPSKLPTYRMVFTWPMRSQRHA
jgi:hypothetical protein